MDNKIDLRELLNYIEPSFLTYNEWLNVGMALQKEGYSPRDWDSWSRRDHNRYHEGECEKKWRSFGNYGNNPITGATIVQMAKDNGWQPAAKGYELSWDDIIGSQDDLVVIQDGWVEGIEIREPKVWNPRQQIITYLELLFDSTENVGYVTETWEKDGKYLPTKGSWDRTAGHLIDQLSRCDDIREVIGDYNEAAGAWIRFNPLDGEGCKNDNVTDYRFALVESDTVDIDKQNAIIRELELPVACLVYSGSKSLHAIVHIDAGDYKEYRCRVDYLYNICQKNGLKVDTQNRNPSRLSRMPGIIRNGHKQFIVDTKIGFENFIEWQEWIESVNDNLPDTERLSDIWDNLPELAPPLIDGILRQGHKMLLAGPSKAGKSFALIELCCAIAEGKKWIGWNCTKGKILYVNLELDRASCLHRFVDVYKALAWQPNSIDNIDIWNLRGNSIPMNKLAPKLIRRCQKKNYIAIIIDPIYKVITGDENSANQMADFCNQFDKVCTELGCAVIYCHHHSKGNQGGKRSMDRASGSGVFARDPDALLDLIELELTEDIIKQNENNAVCKVCETWLLKHDCLDKVSQDERCSEKEILGACDRLLGNKVYQSMLNDVYAARQAEKKRTAWRIDGTLREFPKFAAINLWFDYPVHHIDKTDILKNINVDNIQKLLYKKNFSRKKTAEEKEAERNKSIETAYEVCSIDGEITVKAIAEYLGKSEKTVRRNLKEHGGFWIDDGIVGKK